MPGGILWPTAALPAVGWGFMDRNIRGLAGMAWFYDPTANFKPLVATIIIIWYVAGQLLKLLGRESVLVVDWKCYTASNQLLSWMLIAHSRSPISAQKFSCSHKIARCLNGADAKLELAENSILLPIQYTTWLSSRA